ncbi:MAG: HD domain-containing protein [Chitinispirillaceae bacterium]|nr:HD domain-containing protein [Chitinispirillaceae bacterium]
MAKPLSREMEAALITMEAIYVKNVQAPIARDKSPSCQYGELIGQLHEILRDRLAGEPRGDVRELPFTRLFSMAEMLIYAVAKTPQLLIEAARPAYRGDPLVCHSLNVAFLACTIGVRMRLPVRECTELGVAGLLHDIGMTKIDVRAYTHDRELSEEEQELVKTHPLAGYAFFESLRSDFPWLLSVILEEHKRENGRGYGQSLEGELHTFSRIVGICDSFEALTHERSFRKPFHPADAMKTIIAEKEHLYSKTVLREVIEAIGVYPVGSLVKLNNNKIGLVVETVPGFPLRPIVNAWDENEEEPVPVRIDLSTDATIFVSRVQYTDEYIRTDAGGR